MKNISIQILLSGSNVFFWSARTWKKWFKVYHGFFQAPTMICLDRFVSLFDRWVGSSSWVPSSLLVAPCNLGGVWWCWLSPLQNFQVLQATDHHTQSLQWSVLYSHFSCLPSKLRYSYRTFISIVIFTLLRLKGRQAYRWHCGCTFTLIGFYENTWYFWPIRSNYNTHLMTSHKAFLLGFIAYLMPNHCCSYFLYDINYT